MSDAGAVVDLLTGSAASALVAAVWQGALLALMVWLCLRFVPGLSAAVRSAVWLCVFVLLVGLQIVPMVMHGVGSPAFAEKARPVFHLDPRWSVALAALWLSASAIRAVQLVQGILHLRRQVACASEVSLSAELTAALEEAGPGFVGKARRVKLCVSDAVARPSVIGFFRPRVLIPAKLAGELSQQELRQVLMHELEHLRRADDWTNLLQKMALVVFPLNPALAWVERRLCAERELACDDRVLAAGGGRKAYALCLTHLAEFALLERGFSLVLGAWERRPELVRRVHRILSAPAQAMNRRAALAVSGGVLAAAVCGAVALAHSPQLVSFAPVPVVAHVGAPGREYRVEAMPAPRLVSASMEVEKPAAIEPAAVVFHPVTKRTERLSPRHAAVKTRCKAAAKLEVKLASLRMPPVPGGDALLVMTEWNDLGNTQRMMLADFREERKPAATAVPAVYLVVTPNGWVIVQI